MMGASQFITAYISFFFQADEPLVIALPLLLLSFLYSSILSQHIPG